MLRLLSGDKVGNGEIKTKRWRAQDGMKACAASKGPSLALYTARSLTPWPWTASDMHTNLEIDKLTRYNLCKQSKRQERGPRRWDRRVSSASQNWMSALCARERSEPSLRVQTQPNAWFGSCWAASTAATSSACPLATANCACFVGSEGRRPRRRINHLRRRRASFYLFDLFFSSPRSFIVVPAEPGRPLI